MLVSVVITTYNVSKYISSTINSVLDQTYKDFEIIIIDDGSTDNTPEILKSYADRYFNVKVFLREHTGNIGKNLNDCVRLSEGEIIFILGADDMWVNTKIAEQLEYLKKYKAVCSNKYLINEEGEITRGGDRLKDRDLTLKDLLFRNDVLASSLGLYKSVFFECGMFDEIKGRRSEDYYLCLNLSSKYPIRYISKPLVYYRVHGQNLSMKTFADYSEVLNRNIELISDYLESDDKKIVKAARKGLAAIYLRFARKKYLSDEFSEAKDYINKSFQVYKGISNIFFVKRFFFLLLIYFKVLFPAYNVSFIRKYIGEW